MLKNQRIQQKTEIVQDFLQKKYQVDPASLPHLDPFLEHAIEGIVAIKIWRNALKKEAPDVVNNYLDEVISNYNQMIILSSMGLIIPSIFFIRRSYENMFAYTFYKDHPVEFFIKENDLATKHRKLAEIEQYFEKFPLIFYYPKIDETLSGKLLSEIILARKEHYSSLSNYVHANNQNFLELISLINEVKPDDKKLKTLDAHIIEFNTIFNVFFIIFFFKKYHAFKPEEKEIIRESIHGGSKRYKEKIRKIFGEI